MTKLQRASFDQAVDVLLKASWIQKEGVKNGSDFWVEHSEAVTAAKENVWLAAQAAPAGAEDDAARYRHTLMDVELAFREMGMPRVCHGVYKQVREVLAARQQESAR